MLAFKLYLSLRFFLATEFALGMQKHRCCLKFTLTCNCMNLLAFLGLAQQTLHDLIALMECFNSILFE